jgi:hypothetical protein
MATTPPLALSNIVNITVTVAPAAATANSFNQGLIIGSSTVIPSYGANSRIRQYSSLTAILSDGFTLTSPEYIAAQIYFSQNQPAQFVWIGRQDLTAISTATVGNSGGSGYVVGDVITVVQGGASFGQLKVTGVTSGVVNALALAGSGLQGTGYSVANNLATTTDGSGTGLTVDITAIGESLLQASQACRAASNTWYGLMVCGPVDADNLAIAEWADPLWQTTRYYVWSNDAAIPAGTAGNLFLQLQALKLRVLGIYSTTQSGLYPNNIYAAAGLMGVEMGLNTGLANSFFTIAHKVVQGIAPEPVTQTQYTNIKNAGGLVYGNFAPYTLVEPGNMFSGDPSFLWLFLAVLVNNLQISCMNVLASLPADPQTNSGQHLLINAANQACDVLSVIGFLAGGVWTGASIPIPSANNPALITGQALPPAGYLNISPSYATQLAGDRAAGKAMPIYCAITTAGAVQSLLIGVYTQL